MTPLDPAFLGPPLAHRALHDVAAGRPENSRAAIRAAMTAGYGIEIDLQQSRDGRAMVFHDYTLNRLTGETGAVRSRDADDLQQIALRGGAERIPSLKDVLALVAGKVPLLIEVKDQDGAMGPETGALEAAAIADLEGYGGPVALMSFNPHSVAHCLRHAPGIACGLITSAFAAKNWPHLPARVRRHLRGIPDFERLSPAFISHERADLKRPRVQAIREQGTPVLCWTVRSPGQEAWARRHADNITFEGYAAPIPG
ncbi:Glycerophosphoryl diester phosphodiesterase [Salinihabitans flavidus]|uniref:Glycerophosphoryl diester phosphodiesterase n=1 Tax=Salinihabitans flavidus TaxID=569882 RepID=A0A1H8RXI5_9RHOB|nr:glycerophosphodiester phosphodiesterase family protein [Salinihabitans flavidus]SEO71085.1 Glycerophosphoryl diester phosphodiesterase [Salinihabitans flavidus]